MKTYIACVRWIVAAHLRTHCQAGWIVLPGHPSEVKVGCFAYGHVASLPLSGHPKLGFTSKICQRCSDFHVSQLPTDGSEAVFYLGAMMEHSCKPNARFCIRSMEVLCGSRVHFDARQGSGWANGRR